MYPSSCPMSSDFVWYQLIWHFKSLRKYKRAIEDFNKSISINPNDAVVYFNRGNAYKNLRKHQQAIENYNKAISIKPKYTNVYNNRGVAYYDIGKKGHACKDWKKACDLGVCIGLTWAVKEGICK